MYQRREYKDEEMVNVGFRARAKLAQAVHSAAEKEKARSTSAWLHNVVLEAAAKTLGVPAHTIEGNVDHTRATPTPEAAAQVAQLNALLIDVQERLIKLGVVPTVDAKTRLR